MRVAVAASTLLAAGAAARGLGGREPAVPLRPDPSLDTPKFMAVPYEDVLSRLEAAAKSEPESVSLITGILDHLPGLSHINVAAADPVTDSAVPTHIPNPMEEESTPPQQQRDLEERQSGGCTNPQIIREWSSLTPMDRRAYTDAVRCLFTTPSRSRLSGARNRWDDLAAVHQQMTGTIHGVGQFLPWHRYFMWVYEQELRNTCGYRGPMTWWDETRNAGNFNGAAPFTDQYYGHMPDGRVVCITSGTFRNSELHIGPGASNTNHCLARGCNERISAGVTVNYVNSCNSWNDYPRMQDCSDHGPHAWGHNAMGGVMGDVQSSVQDPVFFLHHAFIDRNWRIWQRANPSARTYAIGGSSVPNCPNCAPTTLNYRLDMRGFFPTIPAGQVMDTQGGFLCYHYDY